MSNSSEPAIFKKLKECGQNHILDHWGTLTAEEKNKLVEDVDSINVARATRIFHQSTTPLANSKEEILPVSNVCSVASRTELQSEKWWKMGMQAVAEGKLAVLLLAGGQGTRLGSSSPKGCYDIGLPSHKSLFQIQAERLQRIQTMAKKHSGSDPAIPWYIMTSEFTHSETVSYFQENNFFGLKESQVKFFKQSFLPCFSLDGEILLETKTKISKAPDGNGGVYSALKSSGSFQEMREAGIQFVECFSVDNALIRVADPLFLGYFLESSSPCGAKVVKKAYPEERVGVFVQKGKKGPTEVMEYSEMDPAVGSSVDPDTNELRFLWSNVCIHLFTVDFLEMVIPALERDSVFHVAAKTIPTVNGSVKGVKLEQFIFDVFAYANSIALFEAVREEEFSPVKNAPGSKQDSPDTARNLLMKLHKTWVESAGGRVTPPLSGSVSGVEISPLLSYAGEELEEICRGQEFRDLSYVH